MFSLKPSVSLPFYPSNEELRDLSEIGQVDGETGFPHPTKEHELIPVFVMADAMGCSPMEVLDMDYDIYKKYSAWRAGLNRGRQIRLGK